MIKWVFGLSLILSSATSAEVLGDLFGTVVDQNKKFVVGANITIEEKSFKNGTLGVVTDSVGAFYFKKIPVGKYVVLATHIGYEDFVQDEVIVSENGNFGLSLLMKEKAIFLAKTVVSASRRQEKIINAPASVSIIEKEEVQSRPVLTVVEHIRSLPAIDFSQTGLSQASVVARGFNDVFTGSMLTLTDNRISRVPSLRLNAYNFIPVINDDIERIELVFGPGSALYGPNSANSVMHIITRSPLDNQGTSLNVSVGERSVRRFSMRHAAKVNDKLGYKISAQAYSGTDWEYIDPVETQARNVALLNETDPKLVRIGGRDYDQSRLSSEIRIDYRPINDFSAVISGGYNSASTIEMTTLGAGLADGWVSGYYQARFVYKDFFLQAFNNWTDAGDSFFLRVGDPLIDRSNLTVLQLQHAYKLNESQQFIYGTDALFTRPNTGGSINGANEDDDDINELGFYLQSETSLTEMLSLVFAGRYDKHNLMPDGEFSPRAALVLKPTDYQTLRLTYNVSFSPPNSNNLFVDIVTLRDVFSTGKLLQPVLGFAPNFDVRAQGTYHRNTEGGFSYARSTDGRPQFRSPFAPLAGYSSDDLWNMNDPSFTNVMWNVGRNATLAQFVPSFTALVAENLQSAGQDIDTAQSTAAALSERIPFLIPEQLTGLENYLMSLNLEKVANGDALPFDVVNDVHDVPFTRSTTTQTLEVGYKGVIGEKIVVAADGYRTVTEDFVGQLNIETPNVFLDPESIANALAPGIAAAMSQPDNDQIAQAISVLDDTQIDGIVEGNSNGTAIDELTSIFVNGAVGLPYGTVTPSQALDPTAIMLTYRNFGKVTTSGLDLKLAYYARDELVLNGGISLIRKNFFDNVDGMADIALNAPKMKLKMGVSYLMPNLPLQLSSKFRYNSGFKQNSGVYVGKVDPYSVIDFGANYQLPVSFNLRFTLNISNVLNNKHTEFFGAPEIGRLSLLQVGTVF